MLLCALHPGESCWLLRPFPAHLTLSHPEVWDTGPAQGASESYLQPSVYEL